MDATGTIILALAAAAAIYGIWSINKEGIYNQEGMAFQVMHGPAGGIAGPVNNDVYGTGIPQAPRVYLNKKVCGL